MQSGTRVIVLEHSQQLRKCGYCGLVSNEEILWMMVTGVSRMGDVWIGVGPRFAQCKPQRL